MKEVSKVSVDLTALILYFILSPAIAILILGKLCGYDLDWKTIVDLLLCLVLIFLIEIFFAPEEDSTPKTAPKP